MHWLSVGESCFKVGDGYLDDKACVSRAGTCWFQSVSCLVSVGLLAAGLVHLATVRRPISQHSALLRPALHNRRSGWVRSGRCGAQLVPAPFALLWFQSFRKVTVDEVSCSLSVGDTGCLTVWVSFTVGRVGGGSAAVGG